MKPISSFYPFISQLPQNIVITFHQKPDADAMGSALALFHFLKQFHHRIKIISPTNWASFLHWMPGTKNVIDGDKHFETIQNDIANATWIFALDFNVFSRTKKLEPLFLASKAKKILIDHHEHPDTKAFDYGISLPEKSSTCEMVYDFIVDSGYKKLLNQDIATALYAGIMTDTGSFRFSNTTAKVHEIVAQLKKTNINHSLIHQNLFDNFSEQRWRFIGFILQNRLVVNAALKTALIAIAKEDLEQYNIQTGDTEGLVQYPMGIKGIEFVALIVDRTEEVRCSFRSKLFFNVNEFAKQHFEGGGHIMAAGGRSKLPLAEVVEQFWAITQTYESILNG